jgi:putative FmdB family regulatory protein
VLIPAQIAEDYVPTYQYVCTECGSDLEAVQSFSDPSLTDCPTCGGKLRKRFGAVGVVFKGSGFYRNDSRSDSRGDSGDRKADGGDKADSGDKPTKPETKADASSGSSTGSKDAKSGDSTKAKPASDSGSSSSSSGNGAKASSAA